MQFRTTIDFPPSEYKINFTDQILLLGSCFSENMGEKLTNLRFHTTVNPLGILYNPFSLGEFITSYGLNGKKVTEGELWEHQDVISHRDFHSVNNQLTQEEYLTTINTRLSNFRKTLSAADVIIITLGTAWVYEEKENGNIVANCHKRPAGLFHKRLLSMKEIVVALQLICDNLLMDGNRQIIFTVSPVRHIKDGLVENNRSKSRLIESVHRVCDHYDHASYFPSFEMMMDDLRDYRFYTADLLHPSEEAIQYIWHWFTKTYMDIDTQNFSKEMEKLNQAINHRPFNPRASSHQAFCQNHLDNIDRLSEKYPMIDLTDAKRHFQSFLLPS